MRKKGQWNAEETVHDAIDRLVPPSSTPRAVSNRLPFARLLVPQKIVVARYPWVPPLQRSRTLRRTDLLKSGKADCVMDIGAREVCSQQQTTRSPLAAPDRVRTFMDSVFAVAFLVGSGSALRWSSLFVPGGSLPLSHLCLLEV